MVAHLSILVLGFLRTTPREGNSNCRCLPSGVSSYFKWIALWMEPKGVEGRAKQVG